MKDRELDRKSESRKVGKLGKSGKSESRKVGKSESAKEQLSEMNYLAE